MKLTKKKRMPSHIHTAFAKGLGGYEPRLAECPKCRAIAAKCNKASFRAALERKP